MTTKESLHQLIEGLPEDLLPEAERFLKTLHSGEQDLVLRALLIAPWDDEPETEEERAAIAEAYEAIERGDVHTLEGVRRELGL